MTVCAKLNEVCRNVRTAHPAFFIRIVSGSDCIKKSPETFGVSGPVACLTYSASVLLQHYCTCAVTNPDLQGAGVDRIGCVAFDLSLQLALFND